MPTYVCLYVLVSTLPYNTGSAEDIPTGRYTNRTIYQPDDIPT